MKPDQIAAGASYFHRWRKWLRRRLPAGFLVFYDLYRLLGVRVLWYPQRKILRVLRLVYRYTMVDPLRLMALYNLSSELSKEGVGGDWVECGVCNGGSAAVLAAAIFHDQGRLLWLYDSFCGIPPPGQRDDSFAKGLEGDFVGNEKRVLDVLTKVGFPGERIQLKKGFFSNTFREPLPDKIALLHIDADWYDSVFSALETFYPRVEEGGRCCIG